MAKNAAKEASVTFPVIGIYENITDCNQNEVFANLLVEESTARHQNILPAQYILFIGKDVQELPFLEFSKKRNIAAIAVDKDNPYYENDADGQGWVRDKRTGEIVYTPYGGKVVISNSFRNDKNTGSQEYQIPGRVNLGEIDLEITKQRGSIKYEIKGGNQTLYSLSVPENVPQPEIKYDRGVTNTMAPAVMFRYMDDEHVDKISVVDADGEQMFFDLTQTRNGKYRIGFSNEARAASKRSKRAWNLSTQHLTDERITRREIARNASYVFRNFSIGEITEDLSGQITKFEDSTLYIPENVTGFARDLQLRGNHYSVIDLSEARQVSALPNNFFRNEYSRVFIPSNIKLTENMFGSTFQSIEELHIAAASLPQPMSPLFESVLLSCNRIYLYTDKEMQNVPGYIYRVVKPKTKETSVDDEIRAARKQTSRRRVTGVNALTTGNVLRTENDVANSVTVLSRQGSTGIEYATIGTPPTHLSASETDLKNAERGFLALHSNDFSSVSIAEKYGISAGKDALGRTTLSFWTDGDYVKTVGGKELQGPFLVSCPIRQNVMVLNDLSVNGRLQFSPVGAFQIYQRGENNPFTTMSVDEFVRDINNRNYDKSAEVDPNILHDGLLLHHATVLSDQVRGYVQTPQNISRIAENAFNGAAVDAVVDFNGAMVSAGAFSNSDISKYITVAPSRDRVSRGSRQDIGATVDVQLLGTEADLTRFRNVYPHATTELTDYVSVEDINGRITFVATLEDDNKINVTETVYPKTNTENISLDTRYSLSRIEENGRIKWKESDKENILVYNGEDLTFSDEYLTLAHNVYQDADNAISVAGEYSVIDPASGKMLQTDIVLRATDGEGIIFTASTPDGLQFVRSFETAKEYNGAVSALFNDLARTVRSGNVEQPTMPVAKAEGIAQPTMPVTEAEGIAQPTMPVAEADGIAQPVAPLMPDVETTQSDVQVPSLEPQTELFVNGVAVNFGTTVERRIAHDQSNGNHKISGLYELENGETVELDATVLSNGTVVFTAETENDVEFFSHTFENINEYNLAYNELLHNVNTAYEKLSDSEPESHTDTEEEKTIMVGGVRVSVNTVGHAIPNNTVHGEISESWYYDEQGREILHIDGARRFVTNYTNEGKMVRTFADGELVATSRYDTEDRLVYNEGGQLGHIECVYDEKGRLVRQDGNGVITDYLYDDSGRLTQTADNHNFQTWREYDERGNEILYRDTNGVKVSHVYDEENRLVRHTRESTNAAGDTVKDFDFVTTYTADGEWSRKEDLETHQITLTQYDADGRALTVFNPDQSVIVREYDELGREISYYDSRVGYHDTFYNNAEQPAYRNDPSAGRDDWYYYDAEGRITAHSVNFYEASSAAPVVLELPEPPNETLFAVGQALSEQQPEVSQTTQVSEPDPITSPIPTSVRSFIDAEEIRKENTGAVMSHREAHFLALDRDYGKHFNVVTRNGNLVTLENGLVVNAANGQVVEYHGTGGDIVIPATIEQGSPAYIRSIARDAFQKSTAESVTSITLPATLTEIEGGALADIPESAKFYCPFSEDKFMHLAFPPRRENVTECAFTVEPLEQLNGDERNALYDSVRTSFVHANGYVQILDRVMQALGTAEDAPVSAEKLNAPKLSFDAAVEVIEGLHASGQNAGEMAAEKNWLIAIAYNKSGGHNGKVFLNPESVKRNGQLFAQIIIAESNYTLDAVKQDVLSDSSIIWDKYDKALQTVGYSDAEQRKAILDSLVPDLEHLVGKSSPYRGKNPTQFAAWKNDDNRSSIEALKGLHPTNKALVAGFPYVMDAGKKSGRNLVVLDIDECFTDGKPSGLATMMMQMYGDTYMEKSSSGNGLHILMDYTGDVGVFRDRIARDIHLYNLGDRSGTIEIKSAVFGRDSSIILTGQQISEGVQIKAVDEKSREFNFLAMLTEGFEETRVERWSARGDAWGNETLSAENRYIKNLKREFGEAIKNYNVQRNNSGTRSARYEKESYTDDEIYTMIVDQRPVTDEKTAFNNVVRSEGLDPGAISIRQRERFSNGIGATIKNEERFISSLRTSLSRVIGDASRTDMVVAQAVAQFTDNEETFKRIAKAITPIDSHRQEIKEDYYRTTWAKVQNYMFKGSPDGKRYKLIPDLSRRQQETDHGLANAEQFRIELSEIQMPTIGLAGNVEVRKGKNKPGVPDSWTYYTRAMVTGTTPDFDKKLSQNDNMMMMLSRTEYMPGAFRGKDVQTLVVDAAEIEYLLKMREKSPKAKSFAIQPGAFDGSSLEHIVIASDATLTSETADMLSNLEYSQIRELFADGAFAGTPVENQYRLNQAGFVANFNNHMLTVYNIPSETDLAKITQNNAVIVPYGVQTFSDEAVKRLIKVCAEKNLNLRLPETVERTDRLREAFKNANINAMVWKRPKTPTTDPSASEQAAPQSPATEQLSVTGLPFAWDRSDQALLDNDGTIKITEVGRHLTEDLGLKVEMRKTNVKGQKYAYAITGINNAKRFNAYLQIHDGTLSADDLHKVYSIDPKAFDTKGKIGLALKSVIAPDSLEFLGQQAFVGIAALENVDLSRSKIARIKEGTFERCGQLKSINLPKTCINISATAFPFNTETPIVISGAEGSEEATTALATYNQSQRITHELGLQNNIVESRSGKLGISVTGVADKEKFKSYLSEHRQPLHEDNAEQVTVLDGKDLQGVVSVSTSVLTSYNAQPDVFIAPKSLEALYSSNGYNSNVCKIDLSQARGLLRLPERIFRGYDKLEELVLPDTCKAIGVNALYGCNGLKSLVFVDENNVRSSEIPKNFSYFVSVSVAKNPNIPQRKISGGDRFVPEILPTGLISETSLPMSVQTALLDNGHMKYTNRNGVAYITTTTQQEVVSAFNKDYATFIHSPVGQSLKQQEQLNGTKNFSIVSAQNGEEGNGIVYIPLTVHGKNIITGKTPKEGAIAFSSLVRNDEKVKALLGDKAQSTQQSIRHGLPIAELGEGDNIFSLNDACAIVRTCNEENIGTGYGVALVPSPENGFVTLSFNGFFRYTENNSKTDVLKVLDELKDRAFISRNGDHLMATLYIPDKSVRNSLPYFTEDGAVTVYKDGVPVCLGTTENLDGVPLGNGQSGSVLPETRQLINLESYLKSCRFDDEQPQIRKFDIENAVKTHRDNGRLMYFHKQVKEAMGRVRNADGSPRYPAYGKDKDASTVVKTADFYDWVTAEIYERASSKTERSDASLHRLCKTLTGNPLYASQPRKTLIYATEMLASLSANYIVEGKHFAGVKFEQAPKGGFKLQMSYSATINNSVMLEQQAFVDDILALTPYKESIFDMGGVSSDKTLQKAFIGTREYDTRKTAKLNTSVYYGTRQQTVKTSTPQRSGGAER